MTKENRKESSGFRSPLDPPQSGDPYDVAIFYVKHYEVDFGRNRSVVKHRASSVVVTTATATALIAVVGATTVVLNWAWLGVASVALAGFSQVANAWDGHFHHRDLWHQRSRVLGSLQALRRSMEMRVSAGEDRTVIGNSAMNRPDLILDDDLENWSAISKRPGHGRTKDDTS